jgi:hypothetical protein
VYRVAESVPEPHVPWLFRRPERAATAAFVVGTLASTSALGMAAISAETQGYEARDLLRHDVFAWFAVVTPLIHAAVWSVAVRVSFSARRGATALVGVTSVGTLLLSIFEAVISGGPHGQSNMLQSGIGLLVAIVLDGIRVATFLSVARWVERTVGGDTARGPLDVAAAAWAWAAVWSLMGALIGPGIAFQAPSAILLAVALVVLSRLFLVAALPTGDETKAEAKTRALRIVRGGFAEGALAVAIFAAAFVPLRLYEQIHTTRDPGVMAIFRADRHSPATVEHAGREGEIRLYALRYNTQDEMVGWDERARVLLRGEALYERVPRARPAPSAHAR